MPVLVKVGAGVRLRVHARVCAWVRVYASACNGEWYDACVQLWERTYVRACERARRFISLTASLSVCTSTSASESMP
eukprot:6203829-Pleurochrysis_carterae.AAC.6